MIPMRLIKMCATAGVACAAVIQLGAQVIWSDNFSSYNLGDLDSNESGGPNQAPNGGPGNPWWGPNPGNLAVANSFNGITPYNGATHLVDGQGASDYMEQLNNIGYRLHGGNNFLGNVTLSWAFYDPVGSGANASGYNDIAYLNGYQSADGYTATKDYTGSGPDLQGTYTAGDELLGLGANGTAGGANSGFYQARVIGASTANEGATYTGANGWFNLNAARTVGWHTGAIVLGSPNGANTTVSMLIDGHDVLDETLGATVGVNTIAVDSAWGSQIGAFDNFALSVPEPGALSLLVCSGLVCLARRPRPSR